VRAHRILGATVAFATGLAAAGGQTAHAAGKRYALLVAIDENHIEGADLTKLKYAISDAEKLSALLVAQGFETPRILRETAAGRNDILRELNWYARKTDENDEFVLFYSGHGVRNSEVNKQAYWMTYGAGIASLDATAIRLSHLVEFVREMKPRKKVILLDHCFSGDVVAKAAPPPPAASPPPGEAPREAPLPALELAKTSQIVRGEIEGQVRGEGVMLLAAARNFAYESDELQQGVFTKAVIEALESRKGDRNPVDGKLSMTELITYVNNFVSNHPPAGRQVPVLSPSGADLDQWIFAPNLPADASAVASRVLGYEKVLNTWHQKGDLSSSTLVKALSLLNKWKNAEQAQAKLPDADANVLAKMLQLLDAADLPEDGRIRAVELLFTA
jgi:hypothetical protein